MNVCLWDKWIKSELYEVSTRSPFATLLSRRAQFGRWSSFGKRVWFTKSHIVLVTVFSLVLFAQFIVNEMNKSRAVSSQTTESHFIKITQTCTPSLTPLVRDWLPYWTASVRYQLQTFSPFKSLPSYVSSAVVHIRWHIKSKTYGYEPSVTDASNPKK